MFEREELPVELRTLADKGLRLFPLRSRGKNPLISQWQQQATIDSNTIGYWHNQFPQCNWGAPTGRRSGFFVIDIDGPEGREALHALQDRQGPLPLTLSVSTARGRHLYFRSPNAETVRTRVGFPAKGIDIRGDGGYVVVPPSQHESGHRYCFENSNAAIAIAPKWAVRHSPGSRAESLSRFYQGQRNNQLTRHAGSLRRRGASQGDLERALLAVNQDRCSPPLSDTEVRRIAQSVARYTSGGPDILAEAWAAVSHRTSANTYQRLLALAWQLQTMLPGEPVALPLERIAEHLGCNWTLIRRYRQRAVKEGFLKKVAEYEYKEKAATFEVMENPGTTSRCTTNRCTTTKSSNGLVVQQQ